MDINFKHVFLSVGLVLLQISGVNCDNGVLFSKQSGQGEWEEKFCIAYNPYFQDLPQHEAGAIYHHVKDLSSHFGCVESDFSQPEVSKSVVIVARGNCTFSEKAMLAQAAGAVAVIIASAELITPAAKNESVDYQNINITLATVLWKDLHEIESYGPNQVAILFSPERESMFDPNLALIFVIAVSNIVIGGFWAGWTKHAKYQRLKCKHKKEGTVQGGEVDGAEEPASDSEKKESVDKSLVLIVRFFYLVYGFLILLCFFYDYLVYVVITLFVIAGSLGLYYCLIPLWHKLCPFRGRIPKNRVPLFKGRPFYRDFLLLALCFGIGIFWGVQRHASYSWIVQDILGYAFCINVMKSVGMPNMKVYTVLLVLYFIYDVFFGFVTTLLAESGESVMVQVATGSGSKTREQLPMVFRFPRLPVDAGSICPINKSLLGFGDVIVPGLLVSHNHAFDLRVQSRRIYYIVACIGYAAGLVITFVALALMESGQPAVLYPVLCTLIPTFFIGCLRGEAKMLLNGLEDTKSEASSGTDGRDSGLVSVVATSQTTVDSTSTNSSADNKNRELLRK